MVKSSGCMIIADLYNLRGNFKTPPFRPISALSDGFNPRDTSYVCPRDAIRLSDKGHTIDRTTCDLCAEWVDACPAEALQIMGRPVSASDLYTEMATDRPFGERSGGGVTLSGGAPLVQQRFVGGISGNLQG